MAARVLRLPHVDVPGTGVARPFRDAVTRRWHGAHVVDEWGFDSELLDAAMRIASVRWSISAGGAEHVPPFGPTLLVANTRPLATSALVVAVAVRRATGRAVRFTGVPDVAPFGPALRRVGGVLARPDEIAGLLRAEHVVGVFGAGSLRRPGRAGRVPVELVAPALELGVPVLPVAVLSHALSRHTRVEIGPPLARRATRGPLADVELAEAARDGVQRLLDEADPPRWLLGG